MPRPDVPAVLAELSRPLAYERELRALVKRHTRTGRRAWSQLELELGDWDPGLCAQVAQVLARAVPAGEYEFGVFSAQRAVIGGKERLLYRSTISDAAVLAVLARALRALSEWVLSPRVYSYRPGRSSLAAVRDFAAFVRAHRRALPDPKKRGLYVLRRDVARYGESIPVDDGSPVWKLLAELWDAVGIAHSQPLVALAREAIRPRVATADGETRLERGVPTGSAIQPVVCNLYLSALDHQLARVEGGFYARYGDDLLFAHPDAERAERAQATIDETVADLGLALKAEKLRDWYFTGCGRPARATRGTAFIEYLGLRVAFTGAVGLTADKARRFLRDLLRRAQNTERLAADQARAPRLEAVCAAVGGALDTRRRLATPLGAIVQHAVDDRSQLRHLDYLLALKLAQRFARRRGVRAFRSVSYASLRRAGLPSLMVRKNSRHGPGADTDDSDAD